MKREYTNGYQSKIEYWSTQLVEAVKSGQREGIEQAKAKLDYFVNRQLETAKAKLDYFVNRQLETTKSQ